MNRTRLTSAIVLITFSAGLAMLFLGTGWPLIVIGALLLSGSALLLSRHFWREGGERTKRHSAALERSISRNVNTLNRRAEQSAGRTRVRIDQVATRLDTFTRGILEYQAQMGLDIQNQEAHLRSEIGSVRDEILASTRNEIERIRADAREQASRADKQFELVDRRDTKRYNGLLGELSGIIGIYEVIRPTRPYPPFGGWAIGGDCARRLIDLIISLHPRWIVEAGSGLSTLLAAQALELLGGDGEVISLEHDESWRAETQRLLQAHGVSHRCRIAHAPLTEKEIDGEVFLWYDLSAVDVPKQIDLLFIDGPPKDTGPLARFPAVPLLYERLADDGAILMDDADRPDEREAVNRWEEAYPGLQATWYRDVKGSVQLIKRAE